MQIIYMKISVKLQWYKKRNGLQVRLSQPFNSVCYNCKVQMIARDQSTNINALKHKLFVSYNLYKTCETIINNVFFDRASVSQNSK